MNALIDITYDSDRPTVSGRELHDALEINSNYTTWMNRMCEYGFTENEDYIALFQKRKTAQGNETTYTDHQLTIDMAKQICMIQRTDTGKRYREYFLEVERKWNDPQAVMARSLIFANRQLESAKTQLAEVNARLEAAQPKIIFADAVAASHTSILVGELAKLLNQNGVNIGQKRLFEQLREGGWLMKTGSSRNMPTQKSLEMKLFEIRESTITNPDGSIRVTRTPKVTGKGQQYFINHYLRKEAQT